MRKTGPTNLTLKNLVKDLKTLGSKEKVNLWKRVAMDLEKPSRRRREVNVKRINKYAKANETVVVPGKVLSIGELDKKVIVAAYKFSAEAKNKINKKGKAISIQELIKENPKGKKVRIIG